jgi:hypothetical protein
VQRGNAGSAGYTGIASGYLQDQMITESMGPIVNRSAEHLGSSDSMIIRTPTTGRIRASPTLERHRPTRR